MGYPGALGVDAEVRRGGKRGAGTLLLQLGKCATVLIC